MDERGLPLEGRALAPDITSLSTANQTRPTKNKLIEKLILKLLWEPGGKVRPRRGWTDEEGTMFELDSSPNPNQPPNKNLT